MAICVAEAFSSSNSLPADRSHLEYVHHHGRFTVCVSKVHVSKAFLVQTGVCGEKTSSALAWAPPIKTPLLDCPPKCTRTLAAGRGYGCHTETPGWETLSIEDALSSLKKMAELPSADSFVFFLQQCKRERSLSYTQSVHAHILDRGLEEFRGLGNFLVPMYVECGSLESAQQVFDSLVGRNEHSWTSLIQGYVDRGEFNHAFHLFEKMQESCVHPSVFTMQALLKACARINDLQTGQEIYSDIVEEGYETDPYVISTLIDFYVKCSSFEEAHYLFDPLPVHDIVSWNALIGGYAKCGLCDKALLCYEQMRREGLFPNAVTLFSCLKACSNMGNVDRGQEIHVEIAREGFDGDTHVAHSLVDMYAKCGAFEEALDVFNALEVKGLVPWNALIAGYVEQGLAYEALNGLQKMRAEGISPDSVSYICSLGACAGIGAIDRGRELHAEVVIGGFEKEPFVGNTLLDLYAKCGYLADAWEMFDKLQVQDVVSWNALLAGYARQGEYDFVLKLFERMKEDGIQPNGKSFISVLNVCNHAGLLDLGQTYYEAMSKVYGIVPNIKHHNCKIDLLGRAGLLVEAVEMIKDMPCRPDLVTWKTVLGACRKWGDVELGRQAFDCALSTWNEKHDVIFIQMSGIYADAHMWDEVKSIDALRTQICARKRSERSWVEINNHVCTFAWGNMKHPLGKDIHVKLEELSNKCDEEAISLGNNHHMEKNAGCEHGAKLSLVYGLINTLDSMLIRIKQNLPLCSYCHMVVARISRIERRNIIWRDAIQLHVFQHGNCSCSHS